MRALTTELTLGSNKLSECLKLESQLLKSLKGLSEKERSAIFLRFWVPCSIEEVSRNMHISWSQADLLLESSLEKLRLDFKNAGLLP
jgi:DNA-directed RNA polymerase specialized sigma24 family protein